MYVENERRGQTFVKSYILADIKILQRGDMMDKIKQKRERYKLIGQGTVVFTKERLRDFLHKIMDAVPSQVEENQSVIFEFKFSADRYYKNIQNLRKRKKEGLVVSL